MTANKVTDSQSKSQPGSPQTGEPVYLMIGKLRRPHGVRGELWLELVTEHPERIHAGVPVFIGDKKTEVSVSSIHAADKLWLVSFADYNDCQMVEGFRNQRVYIQARQAAPLAAGRYYHHEIIGMKVYTETHDLIGVVDEILVTGANDVYVVKSDDGTEILVPAIKSVIMEIDKEAGCMVVRQQEWL
jgi:16S rRNA processing protein RimM